MKKLFFLSLLAFAACKKTNDPPLGASNGGQSYLSCKINGKQYTFTGKPVGLNPDGVSFNSINIVSGNGDTVKHFSVSANDIRELLANLYIDLGMKPTYTIPLNTRIAFSEVAQREVYVLLESPVDFSDRYYYADGSGWINISRADSIGPELSPLPLFQ